MSEITIDLAAPAIGAELDIRLAAMRRNFQAAFNQDNALPFGATAARATFLADRLASPEGGDVALGILEHIIPACEAQTRAFWLTTLGRAIAYLSGAQAPYSIDRRMVLEVVTGISRQGTYKIQGDMRTDKYGDICAEDLRAYLQKRLTRVDGA